MDFYNNAWDWSVLGLSSPSLNEDVLDFSSPSIQLSNANHGKSDVFAEWMDEKIDLSILDGLEGQPGILDDLDAMVGDPGALLDNLMDWSSELLGGEIDAINAKKSNPFEQDMLQLAGLSPPVSPGNKVPDISFAALPELKQESLYRQQTSDSDISSNSPVATTTDIPSDDFDPLEYVKVEFGNTADTDLNSCSSTSPPLTPVSFLPSANKYLKGENCSHANTELDNRVPNTPPLTPTSFVSTVEFVEAENTMKVENNVSIEMPQSCSSFILDSPFNCKRSDSELNEMSDASVKEYNSGNTSLLEIKTDTKSRPQTKKHRSRKKIVPNSNPPVPVEVRRKERKRVQNKDAATRYREKKRKESQAVMDEGLTLEKRNKELHNTVNKLSSEISYLKGLLKEAKLRAQSRQKITS